MHRTTAGVRDARETARGRGRGALPRAFAAGLGVCVLGAAAAASAQDQRGGYFGIELGLTAAAGITSPLSGISQPTRCDRLLYTDRAQAPSDTVCAVGDPRTIYTAEFSPGPGFVGAVNAGYALDGGLRFEVEFLNRASGDDESPLPGTTDITRGKAREWSLSPTAGISDFRARQFSVNAYYDFVNDSPWTPYAGAGVGWAMTNLRYRNLYVRKTVDDGYVDVFLDTLDTGADAHFANVGLDPRLVAEAAAGTVSFTNSAVNETVFGFQILGGADYALADQVSLGLKARWARFATLEHDTVWERVRSHAPVLADGVTPYDLNVRLEGMGYWGVTVGLKYHF